MLNKKFFLAAIALAPLFVFSQSIKSIKSDSSQIQVNTEFSVSIEAGNISSECGVRLNYGDGKAVDFRIEPNKTATHKHTYSKDGSFSLSLAGKSLSRGLRSIKECEGDMPSLQVVVVQKQTEPSNITNATSSEANVATVTTAPITEIKTEIEGSWICNSPGRVDMFEIGADRLALTSIVNGRQEFAMQKLSGNKLNLPSLSRQMSYEFNQAGVNIQDPTTRRQYKCSPLNAASAQSFIPMQTKGDSSSLDMDVLMSPRSLQPPNATRNVAGEIFFERIRVCVPDVLLAQSLWTQGLPPPKTAALIANSLLMYGERRRQVGMSSELQGLFPLRDEIQKLLTAKSISAKTITVQACANNELVGDILLLPKLLTLPIKELSNAILMDGSYDSFKSFNEMIELSYRAQKPIPLGEIKIAQLGQKIAMDYDKRVALAQKRQKDQDDRLAKIRQLADEKSTDLVILTFQNPSQQNSSSQSRNNPCASNLSVNRDAVLGLFADSNYIRWNANNRQTQFDRVAKTPDDFYNYLKGGECPKLVTQADFALPLIAAGRRDGYLVEIVQVYPVEKLYDNFAKSQGLTNAAELVIARAIGAAPSQFIRLKQFEITDQSSFQKAIERLKASGYLQVIRKDNSQASVGDLLSYLSDDAEAKRQGKTANTFRAEQIKQDELLARAAEERRRKQAIARLSYKFQPYIVCMGSVDDPVAAGESRMAASLFASNVNTASLSNFVTSSSTCTVPRSPASMTAGSFEEIGRLNNFVLIRSRGSNNPIDKRFFTFVNVKEWDLPVQ